MRQRWRRFHLAKRSHYRKNPKSGNHERHGGTGRGSKRLKFGMNVASMALRDPVLMAKACATIDVLSNGRLLPAYGGSALPATLLEQAGTPRVAANALPKGYRSWRAFVRGQRELYG